MFRYFVGRLVAIIISFFGMVIIIAGGIVLGDISVRQDILFWVSQEAAASNYDIPEWPFVIVSVSLILVGLVFIAIGQIMKAIFDTANNSFKDSN